MKVDHAEANVLIRESPKGLTERIARAHYCIAYADRCQREAASFPPAVRAVIVADADVVRLAANAVLKALLAETEITGAKQ